MKTWLVANYKELLIGLLIFAVFIIFETYQQLYYMRNFTDVAVYDISFGTVLYDHLYRWVIWLALSMVLIYYAYQHPLKEDFKMSDAAKYMIILIMVLLVNLVMVSVLNILRAGNMLNWLNFKDNFVYFFYHKSPILFVTLIVLVLLVHFFKKREALTYTFEALGKLKFSHEQLYEELNKKQIKDESFILKVKTGSRTRLVPVENIVWIEADDYCVRIHDTDDQVHILRSSLKKLSTELAVYGLIRVHRKVIVNKKYIHEFIQNGKSELLLHNGLKLPVSQANVAALKHSLQHI